MLVCRIPLAVGLAAALATLLSCCGCASKTKAPPPTVEVLRVTHQLGGAHYRTIVHDGVWYQTFNTQLLIVNPDEAVATQEIALGTPGEIGPATDMAIDASIARMYIVIEDDELLELSLEAPAHPKIVGRARAAELGIQPRRLSTVDGQCYVSGVGGAIRLRDRKRIMSIADDVGRIAPSNHGMVACIGRQVRTVEGNRYVGSASDLIAIPNTVDRAGHPMLIFTLQSAPDAGLVGLMSPDIRELPSANSKLGFEGIVHRARIINGDVWIVTDDAVLAYAIENETLSRKTYIDVVGARDVDLIGENYAAIAGTAGRGIYRINEDAQGPSGVFVRSHREPGYLVQAASDGQRILAGSHEGLWQYLINSRIELSSRQFDSLPPPSPRRAATIRATASISADGRSITITPTASAASGGAAPYTHSEPHGALIRCVAAVDGDFWIGHDRGITVLRPPASEADTDSNNDDRKKGSGDVRANAVIGRVRIPGPVFDVRALMIGGGVSFVSESGGFGVCELKDEPIQPASR